MSFRYVGKPIPRVDAREKATGAARYMTDLAFPGMLWAKVKRSDYPHALIKGIDVSKARTWPGVVAVLTWPDVPGYNGFGIVVPDQPVLCRDRVRFLGDAIALVAAQTEEAATKAAELITVEYEPLPVLEDPRAALKPGAVQIHAGGNTHQHNLVTQGDVEKGFGEADLIIENYYVTPRQMHAFLETEGGVATADPDGGITVYAGSQHSYRDQLQIARALDLNPRLIRVVSNPTGGGFGGKDEIVVQIHLALLAHHTRRPVKLWLSREESVRAGIKRHREFLYYRTGVKKDGILVANEVKIFADTGAYATLGGPVVSLSVGHACGPYRIPHVRLESFCVYTNNGISGAFRGFGVNQVTFAMETQMDILAHQLGMDPLELRLKNALRQGDLNPLGFRMDTSVGAIPSLTAVGGSELWKNRWAKKAEATLPWKRRGVGIATALQGNGLGAGRPDYGGALLRLLPGGTYEVGISCPEIGQGNTTAYAQMAAETLECSIERIRVYTGDTRKAVDSGSTSASRSVYTGGNSILAGAPTLKERLRKAAAGLLGLPEDDLEFFPEGLRGKSTSRSATLEEVAREMDRLGLSREVKSTFLWPAAEREIEGAPGLPEIIYAYNTQIALVEVDTLTGQTRVLEVVSVPETGRVINPQGLEGQADGGAVMGMGYALMEDIIMEGGYYKNTNFSTYILPTALDAPGHVTVMVEESEATGPFGAKGVGEVVCVPVTPAITNAIYDAVGVRVTKIPVTAEEAYRALADNSLLPHGGTTPHV
ncbi:MAG: molybdopterin-dependent oxidoreductase [Firmicutes bacterium]|nr:molybdopterin-dependent oxidoreductase [Bacillota bacterium]